MTLRLRHHGHCDRPPSGAHQIARYRRHHVTCEPFDWERWMEASAYRVLDLMPRVWSR